MPEWLQSLGMVMSLVLLGVAGDGNPLLGAPALNDAAWNYGGEPADVAESIANGRNGVMPAFGARLDETQIRLLAAWLKAGARSSAELNAHARAD